MVKLGMNHLFCNFSFISNKTFGPLQNTLINIAQLNHFTLCYCRFPTVIDTKRVGSEYFSLQKHIVSDDGQRCVDGEIRY